MACGPGLLHLHMAVTSNPDGDLADQDSLSVRARAGSLPGRRLWMTGDLWKTA